VLEYWNVGIVECWVERRILFSVLYLPIIPSFHYSIIPIEAKPMHFQPYSGAGLTFRIPCP